MANEKDLEELRKRFATREAAGQLGNGSIDWRRPVDDGAGRRRLADMLPEGGERDGGRRAASRGRGLLWKVGIAALSLAVLAVIGLAVMFYADIDFVAMLGR